MDRPPPALVIEDDPAMARLFARCLSSWGWDADASPSVLEALERFAKREYSLALTDVDVSGDDGIALAKALLARRPSLFVIIVSGDPASLERARSEGFTRCLRKPFELAELRALVGSYARKGAVDGGNQEPFMTER